MSSPAAEGEQTPYTDILATQIDEGLAELERRPTGLILSGLSAGLDMGFGPLLMGAVFTLVSGVYGEPLTKVLLANAYTVGFIFVVIGRSELFTEHTSLAVIPVLDRRASVARLLRTWGLIYVGNIVGTALFATFVVMVMGGTNVVEAPAFAEIARGVTNHPPGILFAGAVLAGWLMGLLSWLVAAAQETMSRILVVWLVAFVIGLLELPHCIAGAVEVLLGTMSTADITWTRFLGFLIVATVGNAVGGSVFVSLLKYGHVVRGD